MFTYFKLYVFRMAVLHIYHYLSNMFVLLAIYLSACAFKKYVFYFVKCKKENNGRKPVGKIRQ